MDAKKMDPKTEKEYRIWKKTKSLIYENFWKAKAGYFKKIWSRA